MPRLRTVLNNIKNNEGPARLWTVIGGIVGLLGLVVSVTAAVVQFGSGSDARGIAAVLPSASPTSVTAPNPSLGPSSVVGTGDMTSTVASDGSGGFAPVSLAATDSVASGGFCATGWATDVVAKIGGVDYPNSITIACGEGQIASIDYLVAPGATTLTSTIGIVDNSDSTVGRVRYSILDAASKLLSPSLAMSFGQNKTISVNVGGVVRVRLQVQVVSNPRNSALVVAGWGSPTFTG